MTQLRHFFPSPRLFAGARQHAGVETVTPDIESASQSWCQRYDHFVVSYLPGDCLFYRGVFHHAHWHLDYLLPACHFLGLAQPPTPEWGAMLNEARADMVIAPHVAVFPALAIFLTVLGVQFVMMVYAMRWIRKLKDKYV